MSKQRKTVVTPSGLIAYQEKGTGPAALFVHGVFLNGDLWSGVTEIGSSVRRCLSPDLLCHGHTQERADADVSLAGQAQMLREFVDSLELERVDLIANDTGGAIAQIFAARNPQRIRSLALTNCDTHDGWPPEAFMPVVAQARSGQLPGLLRMLAADPKLARQAFAIGFENPEVLTDDAVHAFFDPLISSPERIAQIERFFHAFDCAQTVEIEPLLKKLEAPTLIVWGTGDAFFDVRWAYWLRDTIPGTRRLVELIGARLFFPFERAEQLSGELLLHWRA